VDIKALCKLREFIDIINLIEFIFHRHGGLTATMIDEVSGAAA
jgi:hypothetical protein